MNQTVYVFPDKEALSESAVSLIIAEAQHAVAQRGQFLLALSGGGTPQPVYDLMVQEPFVSQMPWAQTHFFWGDERLVAPTESGSNFKQFKEAVLDHVAVPADNVHRVLGEASGETAVIHYARTLEYHVDRFDLVLLGMGGDGHTASLFPHSKINPDEPVIAVTADYDGRPAERVSLTPMILNASRHLLFMATGAKKAAVLSAVIDGDENLDLLPAQRIQPEHGTVSWFVDEAAATELNLD